MLVCVEALLAVCRGFVVTPYIVFADKLLVITCYSLLSGYMLVFTHKHSILHVLYSMYTVFGIPWIYTVYAMCHVLFLSHFRVTLLSLC